MLHRTARPSTLLAWLAGLLGLVLASASALLALPAPASDRGPFLVIAAPWGGGAEAVVTRAGGALAAPVSAPLAALAAGTTAEALRASGALMLLALPDPSILCD